MAQPATRHCPQVLAKFDAALVAYGTAVRMQILRHLRRAGPSMRYQIAEGTGISQSILAQSPSKLEAIGVIVVNLPASERSTRDLTHALDSARADYRLSLIQSYVRAR